MQHHGAGLLRASKDDRLPKEVTTDCFLSSLITEAEKAALRYAEALTLDPSSVSQSDIQELRQHFDDRAILEINAVTAYMNFVNRIAEGLGVQLEDSFDAFRR